jgi:hypothetical protein
MLYIVAAGLLPCIALVTRAWLQERAARRRERTERDELVRRHARERTETARAAVAAAVAEFNRRMDGHEAEARRLGIIP